MKWFTFVRCTRRLVAKRSRVHNQRLKTYRPRIDALEEHLPPGDTILGVLLTQAWFAPPSLTPLLLPTDAIGLAPEGRPSLARGVSPWEAIEQSFMEPRRGGRGVARSAALSPFQGSVAQWPAESQGSRPGLPTVAPLGLADELTDWMVGNLARQQRAAMVSSPADLHGAYHAADGGYGFTGLIPAQLFWVPPALPAVDGTSWEIHSPGRPPPPPRSSRGGGDSWPGGIRHGFAANGSLRILCIEGSRGESPAVEHPHPRPIKAEGARSIGHDQVGVSITIHIPDGNGASLVGLKSWIKGKTI